MVGRIVAGHRIVVGPHIVVGHRIVAALRIVAGRRADGCCLVQRSAGVEHRAVDRLAAGRRPVGVPAAGVAGRGGPQGRQNRRSRRRHRRNRCDPGRGCCQVEGLCWKALYWVRTGCEGMGRGERNCFYGRAACISVVQCYLLSI